MCLTELAKKIDISCVQAFHTSDEIDSMVEAAIRYHFAAAFTLPAFSSYIAKKLAALQNIKLPAENDEQLKKLLTVPDTCTSLNDFLKCFALPDALMTGKRTA